jgi:hypothetical protein
VANRERVSGIAPKLMGTSRKNSRQPGEPERLDATPHLRRQGQAYPLARKQGCGRVQHEGLAMPKVPSCAPRRAALIDPGIDKSMTTVDSQKDTRVPQIAVAA